MRCSGNSRLLKGEIMEASEQRFIELLHSDDADSRLRAIHTLRNTQSAEAVQSLIALLDDDDANIRAAVTFTLSKMPDDAVIPALIHALRDELPKVRCTAA